MPKLTVFMEKLTPSNTPGWIIDKDYIHDDIPCDRMGKDFKDVYVAGPHSISPELEARLKAGEGVAFEMRDDDNTLYYRGRAINCEFEPLDDYGMPNAGCTSIAYFDNKTRKFETL